MRFSLIPRDAQFYNLFEQLAQKLVAAAEVLTDLLEHFENVEMKARRLKDLEREADNITHDIYRQVH